MLEGVHCAVDHWCHLAPAFIVCNTWTHIISLYVQYRRNTAGHVSMGAEADGPERSV